MQKPYLVQTWEENGALSNHYEVILDSPREVAELKKFLKQRHAHVTIGAAAAAKRRKSSR
jgi:hypothetical protein